MANDLTTPDRPAPAPPAPEPRRRRTWRPALVLGGLAAVVAGLLLATGLPISSATTQDAYRGVDRVVLDLGASGGVEVTSRSRVGRRR